MVNFGVHHLPLSGGAPAPKNRGSLPPLPPRPVRRHDAPGEAGTTQAGAALRFTAEDSGNPRQLASNADSRAQPGPQRRGLCPLIVQIRSCQNRAPPACATPRLKGGHPYHGTSLTPGGGNRRSFCSGRDRRFLARLVDLVHDRVEAAMACDGVPIAISDGLPQPRRFWCGRCRVSGCPGLENPLGAVEMVPVPLTRSTLSYTRTPHVFSR